MKIKTPYYLITKFFARKRIDKLQSLIKSGRAKELFEEEFYPLIDYVRRMLEAGSWVCLDEQEKISCVTQFLGQSANYRASASLLK